MGQTHVMDQNPPADEPSATPSSRKPTLSVVIITLNEQAKIRDCLESVNWADEIVVMDSYSTDDTIRISREFTPNVYQNDFLGDGPMRNLAIERTTSDWILTIDADERVTPTLKAEIQKVLAHPVAFAYYIPRRSFFLGRWIRYCGWTPDYVLRLFRKDQGRYDEHLAHAKLVPNGKPAKLNNPFHHFPYADVSEYVRKINSHTDLIAREEGHRTTLPACWLHPIGRFLRTYLLRLGFLDGKQGLVLAMLASYYAFVKHIKIWEVNHVTKNRPTH
jgi:glycosyltransferase involved in cell wall biosynthesis